MAAMSRKDPGVGVHEQQCREPSAAPPPSPPLLRPTWKVASGKGQLSDKVKSEV